ncbi:MAG: hypothetical protein WC476_11930, partial [Phycisphaerae bacterium]
MNNCKQRDIIIGDELKNRMFDYFEVNMTGTLSIAGVFRPRSDRAALVYDVSLITAGSMIIALSAQLAFVTRF